MQAEIQVLGYIANGAKKKGTPTYRKACKKYPLKESFSSVSYLSFKTKSSNGIEAPSPCLRARAWSLWLDQPVHFNQASCWPCWPNTNVSETYIKRSAHHNFCIPIMSAMRSGLQAQGWGLGLGLRFWVGFDGISSMQFLVVWVLQVRPP